jgi:hypothetical protein
MKKFLILTGVSFGGFFVSVVLHNLFYALAEITGETVALSYLMGGLEVFFFFVAVLACPIGFLVGAIGSIVMFIKTKMKGRS